MTTDPISTAKAIKEYGILAILIFVITWQNSRLNDIERRLYECLDARIHRTEITSPGKSYAVLPESLRIKREK